MTARRRAGRRRGVLGRLVLVALVVAAALGWITTTTAQAAPVRTTVTASAPLTQTDWSRTVTVPGFTPGPGTTQLLSVELTVTGRVGGLAAFENPGPTPLSALATLRATISVHGTAGILATVTPVAARSDVLGPFDGVGDDAGDSGRTWSDLQSSAATTVVINDPSILAAFTGPGPITLVIDAAGDPVVVTADGPVTVDSQRVDAAADVAVTYVAGLDTTPPPPPVVTGPASPGHDVTPSWTFTAEPGSVTFCRLVGPGGEIVPWTACASPFTGDLTGQPDGRFVLSVKATDAAGNTSDPAAADYTLDRIPPVAPVFTGTPLSPGADASPTWTFTVEPGAAAACSMDGGPFVPCANPFTADLTTAPDGVHVVAVRAVDAAGNVGPVATSPYTLDRTAPAAPTVGAPPSPSNDPTPTWTVGSEPGTDTECALDGGPFTACAGTFTADLTTAADGTHVMAARATDAAGNVGPEADSAYVLDRSAPDRAALTPPASPGNDRSPTWIVTTEPGATTTCALDTQASIPCDGSFTADLGAAPDGAYTLRVQVVDAAGNAGPVAASTYILDTTAPAAPVITGHPADPSPDELASWTFSAEAGASTQCSLDAGPWVDCVGTFAADLTASADGRHALAVRATDAAGNTGAMAVSAFVLDRTAPPTPRITQAPDSPSNDATPTWTFDIPTDETAMCAVDGRGFGPCATTFTADLSRAPDGDHTFAVVAIDAAGNRSLPVFGNYVLDRVPPGAPVLTGRPASPSNDRFPVWSFTAEVGATTRCALDGGTPSVCSASFTADLGDASDGVHHFSVFAVDAAGNEGAAARDDFTLDATGPDAPVFTSGPSGRSRAALVTWAFVGEAGAVTECSLDEADWVPCTGTYTVDLADAPDGAHSLAVRATDPAGNIGPAALSAYVLDRLAPLAPSFTNSAPSPSNNRNPGWAFVAEAGATTECAIDRGPWLACTSPFRAAFAQAEDGVHQLAVRATDIAGNQGPEAVVAYVLDTTPPPPPVLFGPPSPGDDPTPTWRIESPSGAPVECSVDGQRFTPCSAFLTTNFTGADGVHTLVARAIDDAGNASTATKATYVLDTVAPDLPHIDGTPADNPAAPAWRFSADPGATIECSIDGAAWKVCTSPLRVAPGRDSTIALRAVDAAGNESAVVTGAFSPKTPSRPPVAPVVAGPPGAAPKNASPGLLPLAPAVVANTAAAAAPSVRPTRPLERAAPGVELLPNAVRVIQTAAERGTIPVALILIVVAFLAVQDRIDRRDPKLALAPLRDEPEYLEFGGPSGGEE